ncbi:hypothetical protein GCM10007320_08790 [Pseudorhodoferax aquiterrae]|uniref:Uncharacterized protein n=1 Tax=Pseudorhodoferax aquiterrae TaxID=747304 RepID=A0ABQ3FXI3_9BURK|nr:hypothetical protein GCM10007320_08790 [Pseudorhodoferax aquiterrae]
MDGAAADPFLPCQRGVLMRTLGDLAWKGVCIFTDPSGRKHVIPKRYHALVVTWHGRPDLRVHSQAELAAEYMQWRVARANGMRAQGAAAGLSLSG